MRSWRRGLIEWCSYATGKPLMRHCPHLAPKTYFNREQRTRPNREQRHREKRAAPRCRRSACPTRNDTLGLETPSARVATATLGSLAHRRRGGSHDSWRRSLDEHSFVAVRRFWERQGSGDVFERRRIDLGENRAVAPEVRPS